jgi:hypothetical protein
MTITVPDHFKEWLEGMHPRMYGFIDFWLPSNILKDFSREALRQFEVYLLDMWPDPESFASQADLDFKDGATRYVGEAYLREFGGGWFYTDDPEALFPGRPCVVLDVGDDFPMSPYNLMTTALKRRTGQVLVKVWDGQLLNVEETREQYGPDWKPRRKPAPGITEGTDAEEAPKSERDAWVAGLDGRIAALRERVGTDAGSRLDLSVASLPLLEELVLADFPTKVRWTPLSTERSSTSTSATSVRLCGGTPAGNGCADPPSRARTTCSSAGHTWSAATMTRRSPASRTTQCSGPSGRDPGRSSNATVSSTGPSGR